MESIKKDTRKKIDDNLGIKQKRCAKGTRRNKRGDCVKWAKPIESFTSVTDSRSEATPRPVVQEPVGLQEPGGVQEPAGVQEPEAELESVTPVKNFLQSIQDAVGLTTGQETTGQETTNEPIIPVEVPVSSIQIANTPSLNPILKKKKRKIVIESPVKESEKESVKESVKESEKESGKDSGKESEKESDKEQEQEQEQEQEPDLPDTIPSDFKLEDTIGHLPADSNKYLLEKEKIENTYNEKNTDYDFLYPDLNDPNFNIKIAKRKEFNDTKYDGAIKYIKDHADMMCNAEFELMPHQIFVKNFLSFQTPYNSLLLYHGLGSGKTCSAIGIAEETRSYMKQMGIKQRIIVVASPNVQDNFRLQLFDEKKLKLEGNVWNIQSCIGNSLLREINPTSVNSLTKDKIVSNIKSIINNYYVFMGYVEFANYISKKTAVSAESGYSDQERRKMRATNIKKVFNNRLIIIDEVHNIRISDENKHKRIALQLFELAKHADNLRFLFLSATPMYNSYKEIIWLINLMNLNDGRAQIEITDVFDKNGQFIEPIKRSEKGTAPLIEGGKALLQRKLTGYVSYIRGENPYTFPYRIYPNTFAPEHTFVPVDEENETIKSSYPTIQLNNKPIDEPLKYINVYTSEIGEYQEAGYSYIVNSMRNKSKQNQNGNGETTMPTFDNMDSFGYTMLQSPLEALNIVYPNDALDKISQDVAVIPGEVMDESFFEGSREIIAEMTGKQGLQNVMSSTDHSMKKPPQRYNFDYLPRVLEKYGRIFSQEHLHKYSSKIANIINIIKKSKGIVMIYSQYIDGGVVPIALALEEMGFLRYGSASYTKSLFKKTPTELLDSVKMLPKSQVDENEFKQARYMMITGDKSFSPNNASDIKFATDRDNKDGHNVKVILISKAGAEGLDFKCIRQIHIMEPWYNMNRIEQIIGRGVRNLSHCYLPFEQRNVELYLHSTVMNKHASEECADLYVYRLAEKKAVQIGRVTRLIKETAVDCLLNIQQSNFTIEKINELAANQNIKIELSSGDTVIYKIGDKKYTDICDYMDNCDLKCSPSTDIGEDDIVKDTYNNEYIGMNNTRIMERIRQLFKDRHFYKREHIINAINIVKQYPIEQIYYALSQFVKNRSELLVDKYGRSGYLIDKYFKDEEDKESAYYVFQPVEITDTNASIYDRSVPVEYKRHTLLLELPKELPKTEAEQMASRRIVNVGDTNTEYDLAQYNLLLNEFDEYMQYIYTKRAVPAAEKDWDWYMHARRVHEHINVVYDIPVETIKQYWVYHMLDMLLLNQKMVFVRFIYSSDKWSPVSKRTEIQEIEQLVKRYFDERVMVTPKKTGVLLNKDGSWKIFVQSDDNKTVWSEGEPEDTNLFSGHILKLIVPVKKLADRVGFFSLFKHNEMAFYIKDMTKPRNSGAKSDSAGKVRIIEILNHIQSGNVYTTETTKTISQMELCIILETVMRYMTDNSKDKVWFLRPEQASLIKLKEIDLTK